MGREIERKFLIVSEAWRASVTGASRLQQAYIASGGAAVRIRIMDDKLARLTLKSEQPGLTRAEFEYDIPLDDARELMLLSTGATVSKTRYRVPAGRRTWEIDVFEGDNAGLVVAEIELGAEDEAFQQPPWLGTEVTHDGRYGNASLAKHPFRSWRTQTAIGDQG